MATMGSRKQLTLFDMMGGWKKEDGADGEHSGGQSAARGGGSWRGRGGRSGAYLGQSNNSADADNNNKRGRGGKRGGRGRGRGKNNNNSFRYTDSVICLDEDDAICQQALEQCELAQSEVAQAFIAGQSVTNIAGFNQDAGQKWIYPKNRPMRDYQYNISEAALFQNTLVCLPTGLGKTLIAAVVMYNFNRWYPNHFVIFMAPTRPLVKQQLDACHDIVGINPKHTVELTGSKAANKREPLWETKKVFFLTPQVMQSDIARHPHLAERVRCIVVDEAHKAVGNHSYAQVISAIVKVNKQFRVLALSATPGNDLDSVQEVLKNLLISRVELRTDKSPDVLPYVHDKNIETNVVHLEPYQVSVYERMKDIFHVYTGKLMQRKILPRNSSSFVPFQLLAIRQKFRTNQGASMSAMEKRPIEINFSMCITLSKAMEYITVHGLRCFYAFLHSTLIREKGNPLVASELRKSGVEPILEEVQQKLNISVENSSFNIDTSGLYDTLNESGNVTILPTAPSVNIDDYLQSHPKMEVLKNIIENHFAEHDARGESTRVMIFSQFRESVQEIGNLLNLLVPKVKPMVFMGQAKTGAGGRGLKQKEQLQVVEQFKKGGFNVLVATSVGEEGLDIGEVDLIICFDSNKSPTRNVQRMGRTGRQRQGRIIFLLSAGREERLYRESLNQQSSMSRKITDPEKLRPFLYPVTPRMLPPDVIPEPIQMTILVTADQMKAGKDDGTESDDDDIVEEHLDDTDFLEPVKRDKKRKGAGSSKKKTKAKIVLEPPQEQPPKKEAEALKKCFQKMEIKRLEKAKLETITLSESEDDQAYFDHSPPAPFFIDQEKDSREEFELVCSIFDIQETDATSSVPPCTYVPVDSFTSFSWKREFNQLPPDELVLSETKLLCVREMVDMTIYSGAMGRYCDCGNIGSSRKQAEEQENFFGNDDVGWEPPPKFPRSPMKAPLNPLTANILNSPKILVASPSSSTPSNKCPTTNSGDSSSTNFSYVSTPVRRMDSNSYRQASRTSTDGSTTRRTNTDGSTTMRTSTEGSTTMKDAVSDDRIEQDCFILDENDPIFAEDWDGEEEEWQLGNADTPLKDDLDVIFNDDWNGEDECGTSEKLSTPHESSKRTPVPRLRNVIATPEVEKSHVPEIIPCSDDDSSTGSEEDFLFQEYKNDGVKHFQFKSKSEQHFANYKQKLNTKETQPFSSFKMKPYMANKRTLAAPSSCSTPKPNYHIPTEASQRSASTSVANFFSQGSSKGNEKDRTESRDLRKSFTFKKVPSIKRRSNESFKPSDSGLLDMQSQSLLFGYSGAFDGTTEKQALIDSDFIPGTSSEDEDVYNAKISKVIPERISSKVPDKISTKIPDKISTKIPDKISTKIPEKISTKIPEKISTKILEKISTKIPDEACGKIPSSDSDSDATQWDPDELPPSPVLCRSQSVFRDSIEPTSTAASPRKEFPSTPNAFEVKNSDNSFDSFGIDIAFSEPFDEVSPYFKSPKQVSVLKKTNVALEESQDVVCVGTVSRESTGGLAAAAFSDQSNQEPASKKGKFVFRPKSKPSQNPSNSQPCASANNSRSESSSRYFASPIASSSNRKSIIVSPLQSSRVLSPDFVSPLRMSPKIGPLHSPSDLDSSPDFVVRRKQNDVRKRQVIRSEERPSQRTPVRKSTKKRVRIRNPFVLEEAEGASDDSSGDDRNDFDNSVDRSFVVFGDEEEDESQFVSSSQQQAMYLRSVKDVIPVRLGRIEAPLPPEEERLLNLDGTEYLNDSFCDDDVEYADVGVYTQAMIAAREEVDKERRHGGGGRNKRRLRARR